MDLYIEVIFVATEHLTTALADRGHDVAYFAPQKYMDLVSKMNVTYVPYPEFESLDTLMNAKLPTTGDVNSRLKFLLGNTVNASQDIFQWGQDLLNQHLKVDLVIYDNMAIWGHVIAEKLGIITVPGYAFGDKSLSIRYSFVDIELKKETFNYHNIKKSLLVLEYFIKTLN